MLMNFFAVLTILISTLTYDIANAEADIQTCAVFDIGSGTTKITVADVDMQINKIVKIWHQSWENVELRKDLISNDNTLSFSISQRLIKTMQAQKNQVDQFNPVRWVGIGTSVFRVANNTQPFLKQVSAATNIDIQVLSHEEEGEVGFASAVAACGEDPEKVIAWDAGSGSFQITTLADGKFELYGAEFGEIPALQTLFAIRQQPFSDSINPVSREEVFQLIDAIQAILPPPSNWLTAKNKVMVAIGDECSFFAVAKVATGYSTFNQEQILQAILENCGKSDDELNYLPDHKNCIVCLAYVYALMNHCDLNQVTYCYTNGGCEGILITPKYWTTRK